MVNYKNQTQIGSKKLSHKQKSEKWYFVVLGESILQWSFARSRDAAINMAVDCVGDDWQTLIEKKYAYVSSIDVPMPPKEAHK